MERAAIHSDQPSLIVAVVGGVFGAVLLLATLALAGAAAPGHALVVIVYALVLAPAFALAWPHLPGSKHTLGGAVGRALIVGVVLTLVAGSALALTETPGAFAIGAGAIGPAALLVGHLLYALAVALVGWMAQGIGVLDVAGWSWTSHGSGESP